MGMSSGPSPSGSKRQSGTAFPCAAPRCMRFLSLYSASKHSVSTHCITNGIPYRRCATHGSRWRWAASRGRTPPRRTSGAASPGHTRRKHKQDASTVDRIIAGGQLAGSRCATRRWPSVLQSSWLLAALRLRCMTQLSLPPPLPPSTLTAEDARESTASSPTCRLSRWSSNRTCSLRSSRESQPD